MNIPLKDLINVTNAAELLKMETKELLFTALDGQLKLYSYPTKDLKISFTPYLLDYTCPPDDYITEIEEPDDGIIETVRPDFHCIKSTELEIGHTFEIQKKQIKELIINNEFSESELYKSLTPDLNENDAFAFWELDDNGFSTVTVERVFVDKKELNTLQTNKVKPASSSRPTNNESPSSTALKAIGLLMHHLAKSPKFASGGNPNKSQIKELLLELAEELDVNAYGLSKIDERLLSEALKYLESQKN